MFHTLKFNVGDNEFQKAKPISIHFMHARRTAKLLASQYFFFVSLANKKFKSLLSFSMGDSLQQKKEEMVSNGDEGRRDGMLITGRKL